MGSPIRLQKNEKISLRKHNLRKVRLDLTWQTDSSVRNFDADASAFVCTSVSSRPQALSDRHFVFYGNTEDAEKAVVSSGDVQQAGSDGESITIDLERISPRADSVELIISIHDAARRRQSFGQLVGGGVSITDVDTGNTLAEFTFGKGEFTNEIVIHMASLYRDKNGWEFEPFAKGRADVDLGGVVAEFGLEVE